jgi:hypothetical protein
MSHGICVTSQQHHLLCGLVCREPSGNRDHPDSLGVRASRVIKVLRGRRGARDSRDHEVSLDDKDLTEGSKVILVVFECPNLYVGLEKDEHRW